MVKCKECGNNPVAHNRRLYCGKACVRVVNNRKQQEKRDKTRPPLKYKCPGCGKKYIRTNRGQRFCGKKCWSKTKNARAQTALKKRQIQSLINRGYKVEPGNFMYLKCGRCNKTFSTKNKAAPLRAYKFCSTKCCIIQAQEFHRNNSRKEAGLSLNKFDCPSCGIKVETWDNRRTTCGKITCSHHLQRLEYSSGSDLTEINFTCKGCGEKFQKMGFTARKYKAYMYCSDRCCKATYRAKNREEINGYKLAWMKRRLKNDVEFNLISKMRRRVRNALRNNLHGTASRKTSTTDLLGCTIQEFKVYFRSLFTRGMSWKKYLSAEIHIDHVRPCSSFDLRKETEQRKCFHYSNLQPMWAKDNIRKGAKIA